MEKENIEKLFNEDLGSSYFPPLAEIYLKEGDYKRAKEVCDIGLLLNPSNNDGKFILAKIAVMEDDFNMATTLLKEIIDSDDLYINAMRMLVMIYQQSGTNQTLMIKIVHQILDLLPGDEFASDVLKSSINKKKRPRKKIQRKKIIKQRVLKSSSTKTITLKKKAKKASKQETDVDPKMATLTFVDILIQQNQYQQAGKILDLIRKKKIISKNSIKIRMDKIINGLSEGDNENIFK